MGDRDNAVMALVYAALGLFSVAVSWNAAGVALGIGCLGVAAFIAGYASGRR